MGHFVPVLPPGTKASSLLSRKANPGSKTGTNGPMEPGQRAFFVVVFLLYYLKLKCGIFKRIFPIVISLRTNKCSSTDLVGDHGGAGLAWPSINLLLKIFMERKRGSCS